jgi:hypothetical protein
VIFDIYRQQKKNFSGTTLFDMPLGWDPIGLSRRIQGIAKIGEKFTPPSVR